MRIIYLKFFSFFVIFLSLTGCVSRFDPVSLENARFAKSESVRIIELSGHNYVDHIDDVKKLKRDIDNFKSYESSKINNNEISLMWGVVASEQGPLIPFLNKWEKDNRVNKVFSDEIKDLVSESFDKIISLEESKKRGVK